MLRRNEFLEEAYYCVLRQNNIEETIEHLFLDCPTTTTRWFALEIIWEDKANIHEKLVTAKRACLPFLHRSLYDKSLVYLE